MATRCRVPAREEAGTAGRGYLQNYYHRQEQVHGRGDWGQRAAVGLGDVEQRLLLLVPLHPQSVPCSDTREASRTRRAGGTRRGPRLAGSELRTERAPRAGPGVRQLRGERRAGTAGRARAPGRRALGPAHTPQALGGRPALAASSRGPTPGAQRPPPRPDARPSPELQATSHPPGRGEGRVPGGSTPSPWDAPEARAAQPQRPHCHLTAALAPK